MDIPTKPNGNITLRRYLKNLHPQGLVAARLIVSVDKAWKDGSKDTHIVTTKEYAPQVQEALRNMIPECVHRYGIGTKGWFTKEGLHAFQGVHWDPTHNKSISDRDVEALRIVTEDFFGLGDAWRKKKSAPKRPTMKSNQIPSKNSQTGQTDKSTPTVEDRPPTTVETLLAEITNRKNDAPSFGELYNRQHDGDTAKTSRNTMRNDDASLSSHDSDTKNASVTLANIPDMNSPQLQQGTGDNSTAKSSTHYRLQRDKSRELAAKSQEESRQLLETLRLEREALSKARQELERLKLTNNAPSMVTPSATRGSTGTAADSAGPHH